LTKLRGLSYFPRKRMLAATRPDNEYIHLIA